MNTNANANLNAAATAAGSPNGSMAPVTLPDFARWKQRGRKISVLTAYDYPTARLLDTAGVDCLLVGDTLGMVVQGWDTTLRVTLDQMVYHAEMVAAPPVGHSSSPTCRF